MKRQAVSRHLPNRPASQECARVGPLQSLRFAAKSNGIEDDRRTSEPKSTYRPRPPRVHARARCTANFGNFQPSARAQRSSAKRARSARPTGRGKRARSTSRIYFVTAFHSLRPSAAKQREGMGRAGRRVALVRLAWMERATQARARSTSRITPVTAPLQRELEAPSRKTRYLQVAKWPWALRHSFGLAAGT